MNRKTIAWIVLIFLAFSCSKDEAGNNPPVADFSVTDELDKFSLSSSSTDPENDLLSYEWTSGSNLISFSNSKIKDPVFELPNIQQPAEIKVTLKVSDGDLDASISKSIVLPALTDVRRWGLGFELQKEKSNNVNYTWYLDQMNSGVHNLVNCGPSTVTMAIKWYNQQFTGTAEDARNTYRSEGGWWYTNDIINYLDKYSVPNYTIALSDINLVVNEIDKGNIVIICLDMHYLSESETSNWHLDKFYSTGAYGWGHFFVVKGYKTVDSQLLFEIYDPYSFGRAYSDNTLKGIDRFYRSTEIDASTNVWWDYAIVVSKENTKSAMGLDPKQIKHNYGR